MLLGSLVGLASALIWALTTIVFRPLLGHCGLGAANAIRFAVSAGLFLAFAAITGALMPAAALSLHIYLLLLFSTVSSLLIGDSAYFLASRRLGVARALPISSSYPLLTAVAAVLFLGEKASWALWPGAGLIVGGATLLSLPGRVKVAPGASRPGRRVDALSIGLALLAAVAWTSSVLALRVALLEIDAVTTNLVRMVFATVLAVSPALASRRFAGSWPRGRWTILAVAGGLGTALSVLSFVQALEMIGAARAAILNSTAPLFAAPIARYALSEPLGRRTLVGTVCTVLGVMLVVA